MLVLLAALALLPESFAQSAPESWTLLSDFNSTHRPWTQESGLREAWHVSQEETYSGKKSFAVTLSLSAQPPMQFINLSSRFEEVLPNIPNPPSTQRAVTSTHLCNHLGGISKDRFDI